MKKPFRLRHLEKIVSVFIFVAIFFLISMVFFLAKEKKLFSSKISYYTVINSVEKINPGAEITLKGPNIPIGKIVNFSITDDNRVRVDFYIYQEFEEKIRTDSILLFTAPLFGVLGSYKIEMTMGGKYYSKPMQDNIIPSNQMMEGAFLISLSAVDKQKQELPIINKIDPLLDHVEKILDPNGVFIRRINSLLYNMDIFTMQLAQGGVFNILGSPAIRSNLERMMEQVNNLLATSDNMMNNKIKDILSEVYLLLGNLKRTTETVNYNVPKMMSEVNSIMFRLERMMANLENSPLFSGGSKKKGKAETKQFFEGNN